MTSSVWPATVSRIEFRRLGQNSASRLLLLLRI